ncbi:MAG: NnrU family protein [Alphaproteobacteria bacterium]|nr:NnrU family protein [Alphaproteobacteria bacterium]
MSATFTPLIAATLAFVLGHFVLSAAAVRGVLVDRLGGNGFLIAYSIYAAATFIWMNIAYSRAPFEDLWGDPGWARWLAVGVMPLAALFFAAGVMTANPAAVGSDKLLAADRPPAGIQKITRHPILWAITLWAALHLAANGDLASVVFFGGILCLGVFGMIHMEARKRRELGGAWDRFANQSSLIPFAAVLSGRVKASLGEIGWSRLAAGLILYLLLLFGHRIVIDVPLLPEMAR